MLTELRTHGCPSHLIGPLRDMILEQTSFKLLHKNTDLFSDKLEFFLLIPRLIYSQSNIDICYVN